MAAQISDDDGFHEIQLNGKQLVFLFMAATVVSVVIFLCGVLVGRGVRAERAAQANDAATATIEPAPQAAPAVAPPAGSDPTTAAAPPPAVDDLSYFNRLEKQAQPVEDLKPAAAATSTAAAKQPEPSPVAPSPAPPPTPKTVERATLAAANSGDGYVIQVAATIDERDADAMAKRLSAKGYSAFVMPLGDATPTRYRVRVGRFKTKREAEDIANKLQKEEQFKPWITR